MDILLYVLQENLEVIGVVDSFISLIWIERLKKAGSFELYVPATVYYRKLLQTGRWLARSDKQTFMYISSIKEQHTSDGRRIIVSGYGAEGIFRKRMFPRYFKWKNHSSPETLTEVINAMTPIGFNIDYSLIDTTPVYDVPEDYMQDTMDEYLRYILQRTKTEDTEPVQPGEHIWYRTISQSFRMILSQTAYLNGDGFFNGQLYAWIEPLHIYTPETFPTEVKVFSEELGNIYETEYSCSEEDTFSDANLYVNRNFSTKVKVQEGSAIKTYTVNTEDVDIPMDGDGYPILPTAYASKMDDGRVVLGRNETYIHVEPFVTTYKRRTDRDNQYWQEYYSKGLNPGKQYGDTLFEASGQSKTVQRPPEEQTYFQISDERTKARMFTEAGKQLSKFDENIQGKLKLSHEDYMKREIYVGQAVCLRDDARGRNIYKQVEEIEETFDENGYTITPTFGSPIKTLWDLI